MEEELELLVMQKMTKIELHYSVFLRKNSLPDNQYNRLGYYQLVSGLFLANYLNGEADDFEIRLMEELGKRILWTTTRIQDELRKDLEL